MLDSLFNTELSLPVKLVVAFAIVLALMAAVMWLFKRFGGDRLGTTTPRGRQPRLAVIDAAAVDGRRRLVLIRRDNVEHLVMIGGPSDVLIEQNIVRAVPVAPPREVAPPRTEAPPRVAAEPMRAPVEPIRAPVEPAPRPVRPEPAPRPPRADMPPRRPAEVDRLREPPPPRPMTSEPARPLRMQPASPVPPRGEPIPMPSDLDPVDLPSAPPTADTSLADMAHKLEAALRRPGAARRSEPPPLSEPTPPTAPEINGNGGRTHASEIPPPSRSGTMPEPKGARSEPSLDPNQKANEGKSVFDSLEEEMASLLNKPPEAPEKK